MKNDLLDTTLEKLFLNNKKLFQVEYELSHLRNSKFLKFFLIIHRCITKSIAKYRKQKYRFCKKDSYVPIPPAKLQGKTFKIGVHLHAYYVDLLPEYITYLNNISYPYSLVITTDCEWKREVIQLLCQNKLKENDYIIKICPNQGRDIGPWLIQAQRVLSNFDLCLHIHTKHSVHAPYVGDEWRRYLMDNLLGSKEYVDSVFAYFMAHDELGMAFPPFYSGVSTRKNRSWEVNHLQLTKLFHQYGIKKWPEIPSFSAGTMFWYRPQSLQNLFDIDWDYDDFLEEGTSGTFMHFMERAMSTFVLKSGFKVEQILSSNELGVEKGE